MMKLSEQMLKMASKGKDPESTTSIVLDSLHLNSVALLGKCHNLLLLSLRFNQIQSVSFLSNCPKLWVLELQQNLVTTFGD